MSSVLRSIVLAFLATSCCAVSSLAQDTDAAAASKALQAHYEQAQKYQAAGSLTEAAAEYRLFLGDALGELAVGVVHAGQYKQAIPYFEEALSFVPGSTALKLEYAHAALQSGDLERAGSLVEQSALDNMRDNALQAKVHLLRGRILSKKNSNEQARHELEQAVALDPTFENGYELAVACLNMEDKNCAAKIFSEMSASFGDTAQLRMYFGRAYANSDFQTEAIAEFQKALAMNSRQPGAHYSLAAVYLAVGGDGKLAQAMDELRTEIRLFPKSAVAYAALGHLEASQHDLAEAEKNLSRAAALDAKNPDTFLYLGQLYAETGKIKEAEAALKTSIQLTADPSRNRYEVQKAHYLLGRLLMQSGNTEEGKKELAASQALLNANLSRDRDRLSDYLDENPGPSSGMGPQSKMQAVVAEQSAGTAQIDPEAQRQVDEFKKQIGPAIADSYNNLGVIEAGQKDFLTAMRCFEHAAEWNPSMDGLDLNQGRAAYAAGEFKKAIAPLGRYIHSHPEDAQMRSALGLSQFIVRDYASARATLEPIEADPATAPQVAYAYAESLVETGQIRRGIERLQSLESRSPNAAAIHRALGKALAISGDQKAGVQELETAIQLNPQSAESYDALGKLQLSGGDTAAAIASLERAVSLEAQNSAFHQDLASAYQKASRAADAAREMQQYRQLRETPPQKTP